MKKCYNFLMVLATVVLCLGLNSASAQDVIFSQDFAVMTGSGSGSSSQCGSAANAVSADSLNTLLPGWTGNKVTHSDGKVKLGTSSVDGWIQTPEIPLAGYASVRIAFQAMVWNANADATNMTVYVNDEEYTINNLRKTNEVDCIPDDFSIVVDGERSVTIRFEGHHRIFLDNIVVSSATAPFLEVQGTTSFNNIPVNQELAGNLTIHGYNLTADGTTTVALSGDSQFATEVTSLSNNDLLSDDGATVPFTFSATEAGTYTATLSFTNNDLSEAVTATLTVNVIQTNEISTIAGLRALIDNSDVNANYTDSVFYRYVGHAYVSQVNINNGYSKWMQDETGAIQLYDRDGHLNNISQGMEITNVVGKLCNYFGYVEMNVQAGLSSSDINVFPENIPAPVTVTLEQLRDQTYMDGIQGQMIKLENVTFNQTGSFEAYKLYTVTQGETTDTAVYVTGYYDNTLSSENVQIPTEAKNIIGVNMRTAAYSAGQNSARLPSRYYILPNEFEAITGISENGKTAVAVYPNPTADNVILTIGGDATTVSVYNVMGTLVSTQSVSYGANTVNMSSMPAGVYFLRITNGNEAVGTVKVVRQ